MLILWRRGGWGDSFLPFSAVFNSFVKKSVRLVVGSFVLVLSPFGGLMCQFNTKRCSPRRPIPLYLGTTLIYRYHASCTLRDTYYLLSLVTIQVVVNVNLHAYPLLAFRIEMPRMQDHDVRVKNDMWAPTAIGIVQPCSTLPRDLGYRPTRCLNLHRSGSKRRKCLEPSKTHDVGRSR